MDIEEFLKRREISSQYKNEMKTFERGFWTGFFISTLIIIVAVYIATNI